MNERERCVLVVGGSHSVHVRIPSQMIREAGYRVVLADLQEQTEPAAYDTFHAVYSLSNVIQRQAVKQSAAKPASPAASDEETRPIEIEVPSRQPAYAWRLMQGWLRAGTLRRIIVKEHPSVVHFQSMTAGGMTAYYLLSRWGWPEPAKRPGLLAHLWGYAPRFPGIRRREIRALKEFDHIHTSSPAVARMYREHYEVREDQISTFVRGIRLATFAPRTEAELSNARAEWGIPPGKFVIVHNRHLHRMYRVEIAVDAFIELARRGHDVFLVLVRGSMRQEDYEAELLGRLRENGLADRVALMPPVLSADRMAVALQLADCSVNCVPFDAFPVSILEAMYCRAVPVVRNLESYTQFVKDGRTAFAVDGRSDQYADRIERLIRDPSLKKRMADEGVERVRNEGSEEIFRRNTLSLMERCWHEW